MPKKFKEVNSKAAEARERKATSKKEADERKKKEEENEYWRDDDKHVKRKQDRKEEKDRKKQEQLERKLELQKLTSEEEASLKTYKPTVSSGSSKVTRAEIAEKKMHDKTPTGATASARQLSEDPPLLENPNLILKERAQLGHLDASTIDEALDVLSVHDPSIEKHPEKRMKAAYAAFEERELPRLKVEFPNLRMSQLKQHLRKDWMKSPDNPLNQAHMFNS